MDRRTSAATQPAPRRPYRNFAGALTAALSILDLVRVTQATDARGALDNARDLAAKAEDWGYRRFWIAAPASAPERQPELRAPGAPEAIRDAIRSIGG